MGKVDIQVSSNNVALGLQGGSVATPRRPFFDELGDPERQVRKWQGRADQLSLMRLQLHCEQEPLQKAKDGISG